MIKLQVEENSKIIKISDKISPKDKKRHSGVKNDSECYPTFNKKSTTTSYIKLRNNNINVLGS